MVPLVSANGVVLSTGVNVTVMFVATPDGCSNRLVTQEPFAAGTAINRHKAHHGVVRALRKDSTDSVTVAKMDFSFDIRAVETTEQMLPHQTPLFFPR